MLKHLKAIGILLSLSIIVGATFSLSPMNANASSSPFTDLEEGDGGYEDIMDLINQDIISGYEDNTFRSYANISRQQVAVLLSKALNLPEPENVSKVLSKYKDIDQGDRYDREIAAVSESGIFTGRDGLFQPYKTMTREQMATVIVKAFEIEENRSPVDFEDFNQISTSHMENVRILAQNGISIGNEHSDGKRYFEGRSGLRRVHFAIFLNKAMKLQGNNSPDKKEMLWGKSLSDIDHPDISWSNDDSIFVIRDTIYDAKTGKSIKTLAGDRGLFCGKEDLISIGEDGNMSIYDKNLMLKKQFSFTGDSYYFPETDFNPICLSNEHVIFNHDMQTYMVNIHDEEIERVYKHPVKGYDIGNSAPIQLAPDSDNIVFAIQDALYFVNPNDGTLINNLNFEDDVIEFKFSPDGKTLAAVLDSSIGAFNDGDRSIQLIDMETMLPKDIDLDAHGATPSDLDFSPNGKYLATSGLDGYINIYETDDYSWIKSFKHPSKHRAIEREKRNFDSEKIIFNGEGTELLSTYDGVRSEESSVILWNTENLD